MVKLFIHGKDFIIKRLNIFSLKNDFNDIFGLASILFGIKRSFIDNKLNI